MRRTLFPLALILSALTSPIIRSESFACDCVGTPAPLEALAEDDCVFSGTVLKMTPEGMGLDAYFKVDFEVDTYWKALGGNRLSVRTRQDEPACGYPFKLGTKYLVYAAVFNTDGQLFTDLCRRNQPFSRAKVDLAVLGAGTPSVPAVDSSEEPSRDTGSSGSSNNVWIGAGLLLTVIVFGYLLRARNPQPK
jgi:hypothetical protein